MRVLVTGGAGFIGSHTCVELLGSGCEVVVVDNFSNSKPEALRRVERIAGCPVELIQGDIRNEAFLDEVLAQRRCDAVVHFAGLKAVGESVEQPLAYYDNNVSGTLCLLRAMRRAGVGTLVFSSSATVYGDPRELPITECHPLSATNPYGRSKLMVEEILRDLFVAEPHWRIASLRYFNPVGAHHSGLIGEDPTGVPGNLMPYVAQVACGVRECLNIWGDDYPTADGTGVRDYIHVVDLARGHLQALQRLDQPCCISVNLGTGIGYSVLDVVHHFEKASGKKIPYRIAPRRSGDVALSYADPKLGEVMLGWRAERGLAEMCEDAWRWQSQNPNGYT